MFVYKLSGCGFEASCGYLKNFEFTTDIPYLRTFRQGCQKTIVIIEISTRSDLSKCKVSSLRKTIKFGPKLPYLGIFGLEFEKAIFMFEITTLEFVKFQSFIQNKKRLGSKHVTLGKFRREF